MFSFANDYLNSLNEINLNKKKFPCENHEKRGKNFLKSKGDSSKK